MSGFGDDQESSPSARHFKPHSCRTEHHRLSTRSKLFRSTDVGNRHNQRNFHLELTRIWTTQYKTCVENLREIDFPRGYISQKWAVAPNPKIGKAKMAFFVSLFHDAVVELPTGRYHDCTCLVSRLDKDIPFSHGTKFPVVRFRRGRSAKKVLDASWEAR